MTIVIVSLTFAGLLGGLINRLREVRDGIATYDPAKIKRLDRFAIALLPYILGIAAAWTVPLFLSLTKSTLLKDALTGDPDLFVLFGLGIIAALGSSRFLETLSTKVLSALEKTEEKADKAANQAEDAEDKVDEISTLNELENEGAAPVDVGDAPPAGFAEIINALTPDENELLTLFSKSPARAPSIRGLKRSVDLEEQRMRIALASLVQKGLLSQLPITPTRSLDRWIITKLGRQAAEEN